MESKREDVGGREGAKTKEDEDRGGDDDIEEIRKPWSMKLTRS